VTAAKPRDPCDSMGFAPDRRVARSTQYPSPGRRGLPMRESIAPVFDDASFEAFASGSGTVQWAPNLPFDASDARSAEAPAVSSAEILAYMHLVRLMVARFVRRLPANVQRDDLLAAGTIGLMDALAKHPGDRGPQFEWYARVRIRGAIFDELRRLDWLPRRTRARAGVPGQSVPPTVVGIDDVRDQSHALDPRDADLAERHAERVALSDAIRELPARERAIVELRYVRELELTEIAATFGVSVPRISQLHARALRMLRATLDPAGRPSQRPSA
jgi:RNA polymerase sigma factor for flagellar operon FliA